MKRQQADWILAADDRSVGQARRLIAQRLNNLSDDALEAVLLLTSELVTNAVRHGTGGPVRLYVAWGNGPVRVEVEDQSPEWPVVQAMDHESLNGRGLLLVDGMASGWGVEDRETGKTVWFTVGA